MTKVYIIGALRTAIGCFGGGLAGTPAVDLGARIVSSLLADTGVPPSAVDELILGNVLAAGLGQNPSRQVAIKSGLPETVPAYGVNKVCGSGLKAIHLGYQSIALGEARIVIAGGIENMSRAPHLTGAIREGTRIGHIQCIDSLIHDGLWCAIGDVHMGVTAENLADRYRLDRAAQDAFALESQNKARAGIDSGAFADEIVPITVRNGKETVEFATDEHPRATTLEKLARLRPAFKEGGTVTAGNASGINDGAAAVLLAGEDAVRAHGLRPLARLVGFAATGVAPSLMGLGPAAAIRRLEARSGLDLGSVDLFELNEAFAAQALAALAELSEVDREKVNVNGGAIALGHPIGASGARIMVTLVHAMRRRGLRSGLAALCIGGGMGIAGQVEACD